MSFLAAFFAIPLVEYPKDPNGASAIHLSWVCQYLCKYHVLNNEIAI
jgi:hypothetical protein